MLVFCFYVIDRSKMFALLQLTSVLHYTMFGLLFNVVLTCFSQICLT